MPARLIPLFPLQVVVFPRTRLPLHVFEERYKEMIGDAIRDHSEFGVVLAKPDGIVSAGCTVMVEKVLETYPDGRMDILTRGLRRFEIVELSGEKDYLQAEVRETQRLKQLTHYLAQYIPRQRTVERMKELAPTNGHGATPAGL
jgi:Lon protease-like protein